MFAIELMKAARGTSNRAISKKLAGQMLSEKFDGFGLGIFVQGEGRARWFSHAGGNAGAGAQMVGYPETGQGAVVMANSSVGYHLMCEIFRSIAREYRWPGFRPKTVAPDVLKPEALEAYAGRYRMPDGSVVQVVVEDGKTYLKGREKEPVEMLPESKTRFVGVEHNIEVVFDRNAEGRVTSLALDIRNLYLVKGPKILVETKGEREVDEGER
jgi:hypothetical protein